MASTRKARLTDIARESGCSIATVSRALSQPDLVQPDTLDRIRSVATRLGYVPNRKARALASGQTDTIGVAVPTLNSPIFSVGLQEIQRLFAAHGYQLLIASHEYDAANEAAALSQLISHGVDGLMVVGGARPEATWSMLAACGIPLVQMWEGRDGIDRVTVDNHLAGRLIADHLLDAGHERFGVICGELRNNDRQNARVDGIRAALQARGITLARTQISEQPLTLAAGRSGCTMLLEMVPRPTAIIGTADLLAIGAMIEAQGRGVTVPQDISFAGIDNVDFAAHLSPSLTTVDIPAANIGAQAAALLLRRLQKGADQTEAALQLPITLVARHSTAQAPSAEM
ncbi:MAG: LacI family transcriptional regulator [Rhodobacteraceae bacterium]|nr:MAG: LacI family transcriptional regulator [Paracoccaceae bacterium]